MSTALVDCRTELVRHAADIVEHLYCSDCWKPGEPVLCGYRPTDGDEDHTGLRCSHPTCPMCEMASDEHRCIWPADR